MPIDIDKANRSDKDDAAYKQATDGVNIDRRTCDTDANSTLSDILAELQGGAGTPFFNNIQTTTTAGGTKTLMTIVVPGGTTRKIKKILVSSGVRGRYNIKINADIIGSGRIGAGNLNHEIEFSPNQVASAGDTIVVEFIQLHGPSADIEAYLMATDE